LGINPDQQPDWGEWAIAERAKERLMQPSHKQDSEASEVGGHVLTWQLCEEDDEWHTSQQLRPLAYAPSAQSQIPKLRRWWPALLAVALLSLIGSVVWIQAQIGLGKIETEVQSSVDADIRMSMRSTGLHRPAGGADKLSPAINQEKRLLNIDEKGELVTQIAIVELGDGWARVQVIIQNAVQNAEASNSFRQTRVYQQMSVGWQRVTPTGLQWGQLRHFESQYFSFHYFAQDGSAVKAAAPKLDLIYSRFYAALLPGPLPTAKRVVQLDPARSVEQSMQQKQGDGTNLQPLLLPSPSAILAPTTISEDELLLQAMALALFDDLAAQSDAINNLPKELLPVRNALRLWLIWDQSLPLAIWHEPLVEWVFGDMTNSETLAAGSPAPAFAHNLCAHHHLWIPASTAIGLPVSCFDGPDGQESILGFHYTGPRPLRLSQLVIRVSALVDQSDYRADLSPRWHLSPATAAVALATFFEFVNSTYGDETVRMTVAAFSHHEEWETLSPAIYGRSVSELEAEWNAFLEAKYGITLHD
jgi:hypothetical protein